MATVLQARPRQFVNTPAVEHIAKRALRYLNSGFSIHLRGPAGTGKTTLALHLADLIDRPMMIIFGDNELKSSDLIGNNSGYTRRKVVDNFIHNVVKIEDELKQNWTDARLTLACKEGFTLVYDEFNRSRPEVNNVLLSALEEKLLILPPGEGQSEYIRVNPKFRAIFTSNPEEYCGVHGTQDALLDRLVTINMPEPDEETQQAIVVQKTNIDADSALRIVRIVKAFREQVKQRMPETAHHAESAKHSSPLRSCLMIAKVSEEHHLMVRENNPDFREVCADVLLSRTNLDWHTAQDILYKFLDAKTMPVSIPKSNRESKNIPEKTQSTATPSSSELSSEPFSEPSSQPTTLEPLIVEEPNYDENGHRLDQKETTESPKNGKQVTNGQLNGHHEENSSNNHQPLSPDKSSDKSSDKGLDSEAKVYGYLQKSEGMRVSQISQALGMNRFQTIDALRSLMKKGMLIQRDDRLYVAPQDKQS